MSQKITTFARFFRTKNQDIAVATNQTTHFSLCSWLLNPNIKLMKSIREIFRIGYGPSSSHTMGPRKAAEIFLAAHPNAARYQAHLYGSLSATGKGHLTDAAIIDVIPSVEIVWHEEFLPFHPNGLRFCAWDNQDNLLDDWTVYSIGGGALAEDPDGVRLLGDRAPQKSADFSGTPLVKGENMHILLSHDPSHWRGEVIPKTDIPLTLSGHTHAGQVRLFGYPLSSLMFTESEGWYQMDNQSLHINTGLGCTLPVRIGVPPEITIITLQNIQL